MTIFDITNLGSADKHVEAARELLHPRTTVPNTADLVDAADHLRSAIGDLLQWAGSASQVLGDLGVEIRDRDNE